MKHSNVLVVIDPDLIEHPGIARGQELAQRLDATLELYVCDVVGAVSEQWAGALSTRQCGAVLREQRLQQLAQLAEPLRASGLRVITTSEFCVSLEQGVLHHIVATKPAAIVDDELMSMRMRMYEASQTSSGHGNGRLATGSQSS